MSHIFDFDRYFHQSLVSSHSYDRLKAFVNDEDAIRAHIANNELYFDRTERRVAQLKIEFSQTVNLYGNQMVVFYCTILDSMVENFFYSIFVSKPERLKEFFASNGELKERLGFSLNNFLESESKEAYVQDLSNKAANLCTEGGPKKYIKKIKKISGSNLSEVDTEMLEELYDTRNKIVHDNQMYKFSSDDLFVYGETVSDVLGELYDKLKELDIEVKEDFIKSVMDED